MYVGIDIGTSASRGVLLAADGTVRHRASRPHAVSTPAPGWFEHDAETVWWRDFVAIARELVLAAGGEPLDGVARRWWGRSCAGWP